MSKLDLGPLVLKDMSKEYIWKQQTARTGMLGTDFPVSLVNETYESISKLFLKDNLYLTPYPNFIFEGVKICLDKVYLTLNEVIENLEQGKDVVLYAPKLVEDNVMFIGKVF